MIPSACVIRGQPDPAADLARTRRKMRKNGGVFDDVPRAWFMIDADKVRLPAGSSVIADPHDVARFLVEMIAGYAPELEGVTAVVQFSSSAGIEEMAEAELAAEMPRRWDGAFKPGSGIGAHLWFWLAVPQDGAELVRWAKTINARAGNKIIDPMTLGTVLALLLNFSPGVLPDFGPPAVLQPTVSRFYRGAWHGQESQNGFV